MDLRRSLFSYGFRSGKNVLEGKKIRKHADGADNFADYWTDSDSDTEDTSSSLSDQYSPAIEAPIISEASVQTRKSPRFSRNSVNKNVQNDNASVPLSQNLVHKSISNTNLNAPDIHVLSSIEVPIPNANSPDGTLSETHTSDRISSLTNSSIGHKENGLHSSKTRLISHTVINKRSLKISNTFAKYDEYDAEIMQMANDNGNSLNVLRKKHSTKPSRSTKQAQKKASNTNLNAPDIHVLSSIEVPIPNANTPDGTLSETHTHTQASNVSKNTNEEIVTMETAFNVSKSKKTHNSLSVTNQHALPSRKKRKLKKKRISNTEEAFVRRSERQRFQPLERWHGERLLYTMKNGLPHIAGVDKGTTVDDGAVQYLMKKRTKTVKNKLKTRAPGKIKIHDGKQKKQVHLSLVKKFDTVAWGKKYQGEKCPYRVKKVVVTNCSVSGFIQIDINEEKPVQYMPDDDVYFTILGGKVQVNIQNSEYELSKMDMFVIPRYVPYNIKNIGTVKAVVHFCVGRFEFIESYT